MSVRWRHQVATYAPRRTAVLAPWRICGLDLRVHWIDVQGEAPPAVLLAAAYAHAAATSPEAAALEGETHGLGVIVLHGGEAGIWLLMGWWTHGDSLCQRLSRADLGGVTFVSEHDRPLCACIWEIGITAAEHRRWIETMMTGRPNPDACIGRAA